MFPKRIEEIYVNPDVDELLTITQNYIRSNTKSPRVNKDHLFQCAVFPLRRSNGKCRYKSPSLHPTVTSRESRPTIGENKAICDWSREGK